MSELESHIQDITQYLDLIKNNSFRGIDCRTVAKLQSYLQGVLAQLIKQKENQNEQIKHG